jgi:Tol biopolymer transport system component
MRRFRFRALALALAGCGGDTGTQPSPEADPLALWKAQTNDRIVFMSRADAPEGELYLLDDSGAVTRLTTNGRHENNPALSYSVDVNGATTRLTDEAHIAYLPVYSSRGSTVVFLRVTLIVQNGVVSGAHHRLILANAAGGGEQQLIPDDRHTPTLEYFDW